MAKLPSSERAILEIEKIEDYCLNSSHPRGRHKARVFRPALGIDRSDASWLRTALLKELGGAEAIELETDNFGSRWRVDLTILRQHRQAVVRTV
jgi:hypothetical protein